MSENAEIAIRQASVDDIEQLCRARNNEQLFRGYLEECDGESAFFLVAEIDGVIVGFGLVYLGITKTGKRKSHLPKLSDLYVVEEHRRKGVATALLLARESIARRGGHASIHVSIDPIGAPAMMALAKKHAYLPLQEQPYQVSAIFHDAQGKAQERCYSRLDFRKVLI